MVVGAAQAFLLVVVEVFGVVALHARCSSPEFAILALALLCGGVVLQAWWAGLALFVVSVVVFVGWTRYATLAVKDWSTKRTVHTFFQLETVYLVDRTTKTLLAF